MFIDIIEIEFSIGKKMSSVQWLLQSSGNQITTGNTMYVSILVYGFAVISYVFYYWTSDITSIMITLHVHVSYSNWSPY